MQKNASSCRKYTFSGEKNAVLGGGGAWRETAGNRRTGGFRSQESRTLANFHKMISQKFLWILGVPKPGTFKPGCLHFLRRSALFCALLCSCVCALLRSFALLRLRSFALAFVLFCVLLRSCVCALLHSCICALLRSCICALLCSCVCALLRSFALICVSASDRVENDRVWELPRIGWESGDLGNFRDIRQNSRELCAIQ